MTIWNDLNTGEYEGMLAETVVMAGHNGDLIHAYLARPLGEGPFPGIVVIPHLPGWDEFFREITRRFAQHGYVTICPDIYCRFGHGLSPEIAAKAREAGGVPDDSVVGDCEGARDYLRALPYSSGKVGLIGTCSGGRHSFMVACKTTGFDAAVDCWGGRVVQDELTAACPVAPIDMTEDLSCPLLGLFGNDDMSPSPEQVDLHEAELKKYHKDYTFHRYDGAGHGFWYYHTERYRPVQAMDAWEKAFEFFEALLQ